MVPPRAKVFLSSLLALGVLAGSMPIFLKSGPLASIAASDAAKPSSAAVEKAPLAAEGAAKRPGPGTERPDRRISHGRPL